MKPAAKLTFEPATIADAKALAALQTVVADHLTGQHGKGPWSWQTSEKGVLLALRNSKVFVTRDGAEIIATLQLGTKKPWAIDVKYFSPCQMPLYLTTMAVASVRQHQGVGTWCVKQAIKAARDWPADFLRLDAYDHEAGAGGFYQKCGFKETGRVTYRGAPLIYYELPLA